MYINHYELFGIPSGFPFYSHGFVLEQACFHVVNMYGIFFKYIAKASLITHLFLSALKRFFDIKTVPVFEGLHRQLTLVTRNEGSGEREQT